MVEKVIIVPAFVRSDLFSLDSVVADLIQDAAERRKSVEEDVMNE